MAKTHENSREDLLEKIAEQEAEILSLKNEKTRIEKEVWERTARLEESTKQQIEQARKLARLKDEFIFVAPTRASSSCGCNKGLS